MRYPRGNALGVEVGDFEKLPIGKGEVVKEGKDVAILAIGNMVHNSLKAAEILSKKGIDAEIINMRFVKPLDADLLKSTFTKFKKILTIEDNSILGGFGSAVAEFAAQYNYKNDILLHGLPDRFIEHGKPEELHQDLKLDDMGIAEVTEEFLNKTKVKA
jgi:1-deoxy-D-xylulose-5-phosphate synthase